MAEVRRRLWGWLAAPFAAVQFLTRIPMPVLPFSAESLPRSLAYFPLVGLLLGGLAGLLNRVLTPHLPRMVVAVFVVAFLVAITGALHEDALADCADGFGLKRSAERTLEIMRDSRIGSFGAAALVLSITGRIVLVAALPEGRTMAGLIAALTLGRWAVLPLSLLPAATSDGQGTRVAGRAPKWGLVLGTVFMLVITGAALGWGAVAAITITLAVIAVAGGIFFRRIGGVTGDCFGATTQLVELAVLTSMVWVR